MSRSKVEGTKIAQAAKDLNVTSVTIRRYIQEFEIETATDENGIKVLPAQALEELQEIRKLKEDGLTNPKVMEQLEEMRSNKGDEKPVKEKAKPRGKAAKVITSKAKAKAAEVDADEEDTDSEDDHGKEEEAVQEPVRKPRAKATRISKADEGDKDSEGDEGQPAAEAADGDGEGGEASDGEGAEGGERFMHSLTCQTCSKTFEHNNPRLRDCLECYRAKRKERRRGGGDKHKKVIENPLATQVLSRSQSPAASAALAPGTEKEEKDPSRTEREREPRRDREAREPREGRDNREAREPRDREGREPRENRETRESREQREGREPRENREPRDRDRSNGHSSPQTHTMAQIQRTVEPSSWAQMQKPVRSYRKAIEETRLITGSLKRRLERPDLPEGERRWLEQIYAYQLILHQGWRHLAEYKSGSPTQKPQQED